MADQLDCALDLMRRMPPSQIEDNLASLIDLVPHLTEQLLSAVDQPLKIAHDTHSKKDYLLCDYNRDGDSYRYWAFLVQNGRTYILSGRHGPTVMTLLSTTVKLLPPNYVRWRSKRTKSSTSTANCTFLLLAILRRVYPLQGTTKEACHLFIAGIWTLGLPAASLSRRVSGFLRFFALVHSNSMYHRDMKRYP